MLTEYNVAIWSVMLWPSSGLLKSVSMNVVLFANRIPLNTWDVLLGTKERQSFYYLQNYASAKFIICGIGWIIQGY